MEAEEEKGEPIVGQERTSSWRQAKRQRLQTRKGCVLNVPVFGYVLFWFVVRCEFVLCVCQKHGTEMRELAKLRKSRTTTLQDLLEIGEHPIFLNHR